MLHFEPTSCYLCILKHHVSLQYQFRQSSNSWYIAWTANSFCCGLVSLCACGRRPTNREASLATGDRYKCICCTADGHGLCSVRRRAQPLSA